MDVCMMRDRLAEAGIEPKHLHVGTQRLPCPACDKGSKDTALSLLIDERGAAWLCHRCGLAGAANGESLKQHQPAAPPARSRKPELGFSDYAAGIWNATFPITADTVAGRYLLGRKCRLPPAHSDLRWIPSLKHPDGSSYPALIGLVTHVHDARQKLGLHRTWIQSDGGGKVDKRYLCSPLGDGVIRLWSDEDVETGLGIAEGIETALSLAHDYTPVWATLDKGHLEKFPVLAGVEALMISVDHDVGGIKAARVCKDRWETAGKEVHTVISKTAGHDLNDEVIE